MTMSIAESKKKLASSQIHPAFHKTYDATSPQLTPSFTSLSAGFGSKQKHPRSSRKLDLYGLSDGHMTS
jgi:hypothetical protein